MLKNNKTLNLIKLGLIIAVFIAPLIAANIYYYYGLKKGGVTNHGVLLTNQNNIQNKISDLDFNQDFNIILNQKFKLSNIKINKYDNSKWQILYFVPNYCGSDCENVLYKLQQVHIALGKNLNRAQRVVVHSGLDDINNMHQTTSLNNWKNIYYKYPYMTSVLTNKNISKLNLSINNIYLADPLGNIILSYEIKDPRLADKLFKDAKKLLNLSKIG